MSTTREPSVIRRSLRPYLTRSAIVLTLVLLAYLCLWTWFTNQREMRTGMRIQAENGEAGLDYFGPDWLPQRLKERSPFWRITFVSLEHQQTDRLPGEQPKMISKELLAEIAALSHLEGLFLTMRDVTDADLVHIGRLKRLNRLSLVHTSITDAGLDSLKHLSSLKTLHLSETRTTIAGRNALRKALPNCQIDPQP